MSYRQVVRSVLAALLLATAFSSCDRLLQNGQQQRLALGEKRFSEGNYPAAVLAYEAALDGTPKTAEIHYKLALLYDDRLNEPIGAVHHFQRYLDLAPSAPHAKEARAFLKEDQMKLMAALGSGATVSQEQAVRLKNDNLALRKQVAQLHIDLEAAVRARSAAFKLAGKAGLKFEQVQKPLVEGKRTYTVESGDTLASIARKFYKSGARWKDIQEANFEPMEGTARLKPGMVLTVP